MSDGILEVIVETGTKVWAGNVVDDAIGASMTDAAKSELSDILGDALGEPLEEIAEIIAEKLPIGESDLFEAAGEAFSKTLEVVDFVNDVRAIADNSQLNAAQKEAVILFKIIEQFAPWMTGSLTELAERMFETFNEGQVLLDALIDQYPEHLSRGPDGGILLELPGQPPVPIEDFADPHAPPAVPEDLTGPADPDNPSARTPLSSPPAAILGLAGSTNGAPLQTCPLILDLDGIAVTALGPTAATGSNVYLDLDSDGFAERTAWILPEGQTNNTGTGGDDAFLVRDVHGNGIIDDETEMFCVTEVYETGFDNLAALDSNGDGRVNARYAAFSELQLWIDENGDGVSDADELHTLDDCDFLAISVVMTGLPARSPTFGS
ncbi:hypothetical protein [Mameliella alba]|uniref:Putative Calcium binding hemolysin protein n=1 Tax=Mameliella alba TaxID=561184 RepID=A0A0B3S6W7_9RHOB|nr:hypothetical protein [Mameliella alba]KHQ54743.1 putative Calcium binding hemolysin protein [Mameliella alba]